MPSCPRCDATTGASDRFCMACGQALDESVPDSLPAPPADPAETPLVPVPPPTDDAGVDLVACPRCGASNAGRRRHCGRCGASLLAEPHDGGPADGDDAFPLEDDRQTTTGWHPEPEPRDRALGRRRGLGVVVVALGMLVGTGLGLAAGMGMGPFATVEPVAFDPTAYARDPVVLEPATAGSSSTAPVVDGRRFGPDATVDGDLGTAWMPTPDEGTPRLRHGFVTPVWVTRVEVATGDQVDADAFAAAGRVVEAQVDLGTQRLDVTIADRDGVQLVTLPDPVLTDQVTWHVTGTAGGTAAIAEVRYVGWPADEADREAYRARG